MEFLNKVQFGFDIATSLSILSAAIAFIVTSIIKVRAERRRGINDRVKSKALEKVLEIQKEFEDAFRDIIHMGISYEKKIDSNYKNGLLTGKLSDKSFLSDRMTEITLFRESLDRYYDVVQSRRYTLVPVLDSVPKQQDFLKKFLVDITQIGNVHNEIASFEALIKELLTAKDILAKMVGNNYLNEEENVSNLFESVEFRNIFSSIISDKDYLFWTTSLIRDEYKETFANNLIEKSHDEMDQKELKFAFLNFCTGMLREPNLFISQVMAICSSKFQDARQECKDIVLKLAAITGFLLSKNETETLSDIIEKYESSNYLGRNEYIR